MMHRRTTISFDWQTNYGLWCYCDATAARLEVRWRYRSSVATGSKYTVNEKPHPARLGRVLHHETNPPHTRADHPQAQDR